MVDLETLLQPALDDVPAPKPLAVVRDRAGVLRRRLRMRRIAGALVAVSLIGAGVVAAVRARDDRAAVSVVGPSGSDATTVRVGPPSTLTMPAMDMLSAYGSIWVSQPDRVARLDPRTGRIEATIPVPGSSDFRHLAAGAGSIWIDDTGTSTLTRIDPAHNSVLKALRLNANPLVIDGLAFVDGMLWIARPEPQDDSRGDVIAIDPASYQIAHRVTIPRTFGIMPGGDHSLFYVRGSDLLRFDTRSLRVATVRHDTSATTSALAFDEHLWLLTAGGVTAVDSATGAAIGPRIVPEGSVNVTVAVSAGVVWIASQEDSTKPGTATPYDIDTGRSLAPPTRVGGFPPVVAMTALDDALWVASGSGVTRVPFTS